LFDGIARIHGGRIGVMIWVAWKMLIGDTAKYVGIVFGVAFGTLLIAQQSAIFVGLMRRTSSQILDVTEPDLWAMDRRAPNVDDILPMSEGKLMRVRGVPGVEWAVRLYKGMARVRMADGSFRQGILMGLDDATLVGAPREMALGSLADLRRPNAVIVDVPGFMYLFPGEPLALGKTLEMNDRRAVIVGVCKTSQPFQTFPVIFTRYSQATKYVPRERNATSFVLAKASPGVDPQSLCRSIEVRTGLAAKTNDEFFWYNIGYFMRNTGIPINFGITVALGFIVGAAIAGQTFYLFTLDNLKQFGGLKAMGATNLRLVGMILSQAAVVGVVGYGLGIGMAAAFFVVTGRAPNPALWGMYLPWQVAAITAAAVLFIVIASSLLCIRRVLVLEPAEVFK
jgi:putative ABC transport system permease protein